MKPQNRVLALGALLPLLAAGHADAWHGKGHHVATTLAVEAAGKGVPEFFRAGAATIAHCSLDPDLFTRPIGPDPLHSAEGPEHYFDVELLKGVAAPPTRYEFVQMCARNRVNPGTVGLLPYAVTEWTQRLTVAFAEQRAYPENPHIRAKCLVYAGLLSHYAQDLCQPLHVTVHWDGRAGTDANSPRSGIHTKVDALLGKLVFSAPDVLKAVEPAAFDMLMAGVLAEIGRSHALVDRVYEIEKELPDPDKPLPKGPAVTRFATDRLQAAAKFTASLYLTAWKDSAKIKLPSWYGRPFSPPPQSSLNRPAPSPCQEQPRLVYTDGRSRSRGPVPRSGNRESARGAGTDGRQY